MRTRTIVFILAFALCACGGGHVPLPSVSATNIGDTTGLVARGEYIVRNVAVCGSCHAADPKNSDGALSGGMAFRGWRLGTVRAANLTPDAATGLGGWSEAEIMRAIRDGEDRNGRVLAPVMPYFWFHDMSDRDAFAVARYLKSQPAISNVVKSRHSLAYKFGELFFLHVDDKPSKPAPARAATAQYGEYLAQHVALCADCHTQRGGLQQTPQMDKLLAGSAHPPSDFPANPANLTPDVETGTGDWSDGDFLRTIRTGIDPEGHKLNPFMPFHALARMSDDDLLAIFRYLHSLKPIRNPVPHRHH